MILIEENDIYKREKKVEYTLEETITFKLPVEYVYEKTANDWYIVAAIGKIKLITEDRHLLTSDLIMSYWYAIREGFQHQLDSALKREYDRPRHKNTIAGIKGYIERISKANS